jgi:pimeloyl-ACP methyl ester carboxylesterase
MTRRPVVTGALAALAAAATISSLAVAPATAAPPARAGGASVAAVAALTPTEEARKVDRVKTPRPDWFTCEAFAPGAECASVALPLDYDNPTGKTTDVAVLRLTARDPARRIGTLFLNPGGPGGSGVQFAAFAPLFLSPSVLDRFDIIGFDPRGTNYSDPVKCWKNLGQQFDAIEPILTLPFPYERPELRAYARAADTFGQACSTQGKTLAGSMSTAEVARDMDVLRRMAGDTKLTYLGFSYGSYLGTVYSQMFPGRVRAVAIDGVIDPVAWAGTSSTASVPQTQRIRSGEGAAKALQEILRRCQAKGPDYCRLAASGDPAATYAEIVAELKAAPVVISDPDTGEVFLELSYPVLTSLLLGDLYAPEAGSFVDLDLSAVLTLLEEEFPAGTRAAARQAKRQAAARTLLVDRVTARADAARSATAEKQRLGRAAGWAFPYDNSPEAFQSVLCTDGRNPSRARDWATYAAAGDRTAPDFGRIWTWASAPCATSTWTVRDEDAYRGPFTRSTSSPVLVVGSSWDPATNYRGAVTTSLLLPNSRLLSSANWGHTAYGTSACATNAVDRYLLTQRVPAVGARCVGDVQPFTDPLDEEPGVTARARGRILPPVVPPLPGAVPRG